MDSLEVNKLEWDIVDRFDKGDSDAEVAEYIKTYTATTCDLIQVIRQLYNELQEEYKNQAGASI